MLLTKSLYLKNLQCPLLLWNTVHNLLPNPSIADELKFKQGRIAETYAHQLFPNALNCKEESDITRNERLNKNVPLFEQGFVTDGLFARTDVLEPTENGWNLYEIKASTKVKPEHIPDLAFQKYVCEQCGLTISGTYVILLNKTFERQGTINPQELFVIEDVTEKVTLITNLPETIAQAKEILESETPPDTRISAGCNKPKPCGFKEECWGTLPEYNVTHLTDWRLYWKLFCQGIEDITDIPPDTVLKDKDKIIVQAEQTQQTIVSKEHIKHFLSSLTYPLVHFDFETFDSAVPLYDTSRPWQKIPFQYSIHIQDHDKPLIHHDYLADGESDPRVHLLEQMKKDIPEKGSIVVFNKTFEITILRELARDFPDYEPWIQTILGRIIDLAVPFQSFAYYNPLQKGKYSIKKVLPALTGKSYDDLDINNGANASALYFESHITKEIVGKEKIRQDLLTYCGLDTEGMVWIVNALEKLIKE